MKRLSGFILLMLVALVCFTTSVPQPFKARAASGIILVLNNCSGTPSPAPVSGQQVTIVDQNGFQCVNATFGGTVTVQPQGCGTAAVASTVTKPFSNAGGSSNLLLVTGVASQKIHICGINVGPVASAVNVALVEGTTSSNPCDTSTTGVMTGSTAATGWQFAANGGLTYGNGIGFVGVTATNADNLCMLFSGGVQVSGVLTYAVY